MSDDRIADVIEALLSKAQEAALDDEWSIVVDRARRVLNTNGASPDARRQAEDFLRLADVDANASRSTMAGVRPAEAASAQALRSSVEEIPALRSTGQVAAGAKDPVPVSPALIKLFYSYADADAAYQETLLKSLAGIRWSNKHPNSPFHVSEWHRALLGAGEVLAEQVERNLQDANVIILLLSPDYLAEQFTYEDGEVTQALLRAAAGQVRLVPVMLKPTEITDFVDLVKYKPLPDDGPVTVSGNQDLAFQKVAEGIRLVCLDLARGLRGEVLQPKVAEARQRVAT
jgi:hypothetical protein